MIANIILLKMCLIFCSDRLVFTWSLYHILEIVQMFLRLSFSVIIVCIIVPFLYVYLEFYVVYI